MAAMVSSWKGEERRGKVGVASQLDSKKKGRRGRAHSFVFVRLVSSRFS